ncbi:MAG: universal stress protein [Candidatus Marinimicrobia bacterium]|nr:universal stress protein [Candidatus Neomarinimicrobiota bacterium]
MKILIAISSKEYSGPTLDVGMNIARILKASTTIVDVGQKISEFSMKDVSLANELMESWDIDRPGVDVLEWAYKYLEKNQFIDSQDMCDGFPKHSLVDSGAGRAEMLLQGSTIEDLSLILRNGEIIDELRDEVQTHEYDLTIIGGSGKRSMAHDLVQYIDSSIFVVNNFDLDQNYKILLAVDDSPGTSKAVKYGVRVAQAFNNKVDLLTISNDEHFGDEYRHASARAVKMMRRSGVEAEAHFKVGDPVDSIVETAGQDHIIIMGASTQSPIAKFFLGSKPLNVMRNCDCPVLIVK